MVETVVVVRESFAWKKVFPLALVAIILGVTSGFLYGYYTPKQVPAESSLTVSCVSKEEKQGNKTVLVPEVSVSWLPIVDAQANILRRKADQEDFSVLVDEKTPPFRTFIYRDGDIEFGHVYTYTIYTGLSAQTDEAVVNVTEENCLLPINS